MCWYLLLATSVLLSGAWCQPQHGGVKAVKGGAGGVFLYNATANLDRFRMFNTTARNASGPAVALNFELGVCYKEVPTASIAKDPQNIPAGNGSTPALSRVRACCDGYTRNIYNYRRCDPLCKQECVNALCTAPDTCTCFPDHVRNAAGYCVATCPVGCQHGRCDGARCICEPGYGLDVGRAFCVPLCRGDCGGHGNCTAPDTCACDKEFRLGSDGSCHASCANCANGDCVGPNTCVCHKGYNKNQHGECVPVCSKGCTNGACVAPDVCTCQYGFHLDEAAGICEPKCLTPCINALCTGPDTCTCKPGYIRDKANPLGNVCLPNCPGGCPNGICSGPNFCICNYGFVKDRGVKGSQTCVKSYARVSRAIEKLLTFKVPE